MKAIHTLQRAVKEGKDRFLFEMATGTGKTLVAEIEAEQVLVTADRELIARFEKKIQATLACVWGEDKPVPAEA